MAQEQGPGSDRRREQVAFAAGLGAAAGASWGAGRRWRVTATTAALGAGALGAAEAAGRARQQPGELPPLALRIASTSALAGPWGLVLGRAGLGSAAIGAATGAAVGLAGVRPAKVAAGPLAGLAIGRALGAIRRPPPPAVVASLAAVGCRVVSATLFRTPQVTLGVEGVRPEDVPNVVAHMGHGRRIGVGYVAELAQALGGTYVAAAPDVGIVGSVDELAGPDLDPGLLHPLVRHFYEHTSSYALDIVPQWRRWVRPGYLLYRRALARPLGQANLPTSLRQAQRGVVGRIDTIALPEVAGIAVRGWIRSYADTDEAIYVGIYTTYRREGVGYVSVGFPLPGGSLTATLAPSLGPGGGLVLSSASRHPDTGHHLAALDRAGRMTTLELPGFRERLEVEVDDDGQLRARHAFSLFGRPFLVLHYRMARKVDP